jgi:hypothetical protein
MRFSGSAFFMAVVGSRGCGSAKGHVKFDNEAVVEGDLDAFSSPKRRRKSAPIFLDTTYSNGQVG